jgi:Immunity protein 50
MHWYEHAHNPEAITSIFSIAPTLEKARLIGLNLCPQNGEATLSIQLLEFPDNPSPRWSGKGFNVVQVQINCFCVGSLEISGWERDDIISIQVERSQDGKLRFVVKSSQCKLNFTFSAFRIVGISGYKTESAHQ